MSERAENTPDPREDEAGIRETRRLPERDDARRLYRDMLRFRRFEEAAARAYGMGQIYGFCHLHIGQEALAACSGSLLGDADVLISGYRIHTMALARGMSEEAAMCELFGKAPGCVGGLGGSMHLFDVERGFYGGWGLVGQQVPTAAGIAFAMKYRETGGVTLCFLGDGAIHQGAVHETLNLASIWDLPIVFVVENNHYGMGTAVDRISSLPPLHRLGEPYDIEHRQFNGMDALATWDALQDAIEGARKDSRPRLLEALCSRFKGHSMSDPGKYRTREELEEEKSRDPIPGFASWLREKQWVSEDEFEAWDKEYKDLMKEVLKTAKDADWPDEALADRFVHAEADGGSR